jgi:hypothetical protein
MITHVFAHSLQNMVNNDFSHKETSSYQGLLEFKMASQEANGHEDMHELLERIPIISALDPMNTARLVVVT